MIFPWHTDLHSRGARFASYSGPVR